jgi:Zn-dependent alcohol dehydrogenase
MNAKAAVLYEAGSELEVKEIGVDDPREGEVQVRVSAAGLCHSDLSMIEGKIPQQLPVVPGHEAAGIVEQVGPGVTALSPGDSVLLVYRASCGKCRYCAKGRRGLCDYGKRIRATGKLLDGTSRFHDGDVDLHHFSGVSAFSELVVVPESGAVKVDPDLPRDVLSVVGCAVLTGFGAVTNAASVQAGESAIVIGCGGIGLNVLQACRVVGANPIIAVDRSPETLELSRSFGATDVIQAGEGDVVAAVQEITGDGADYAFEAVGAPGLVEEALAAVRPGGTVIAIGAPTPQTTVTISPLQLLSEEKTLRGSLYGSSNFQLDIPKIVGLWQAGKLDITDLVQHEYGLDEINEGFAALAKGQVGRTILAIS